MSAPSYKLEAGIRYCIFGLFLRKEAENGKLKVCIESANLASHRDPSRMTKEGDNGVMGWCAGVLVFQCKEVAMDAFIKSMM
jgi:hypothetical protein